MGLDLLKKVQCKNFSGFDVERDGKRFGHVKSKIFSSDLDAAQCPYMIVMKLLVCQGNKLE
jgi:hypothetical protein